jgi:tRNA 2-thiouridine synthesizing protein A
MNQHPSSLDAADITVDGTSLRCVTLLLRLRKQIDDAKPGTVVHVIATDPAAPLDLPAWCHMTGHHYLGPVADDADRPVYACGWPPTPAPPGATRPGAQSIRVRERARATSSRKLAG